MSSQPPGKSTSDAEIGNISTHGIWLLSGDEEFFLSYEDFPWFKDVPIGRILNVQQPAPGHFYWPELDVDLGLDSIQHPERFPLRARESFDKSSEPTR